MADEQISSMIYIDRDQMTSMLSDSELTTTQQQKVDDMIENMNTSADNDLIGGIAVDSSTMYPMVLPGNPTFSVPLNPLLPPEYSEVLDYNTIQYMNGILRTQIGRYVRVKYSMGTSGVEEYDGFLIGVGINYVVLQYYLNNNIQIIDFYGIKSMTVFYKELVRPVYAPELYHAEAQAGTHRSGE